MYGDSELIDLCCDFVDDWDKDKFTLTFSL